MLTYPHFGSVGKLPDLQKALLLDPHLQEMRGFEHKTCAANLWTDHDVILYVLYSARIEGTVNTGTAVLELIELDISVVRATILSND